ncbi:haloacid dehalogenase, type II [Verruconis gallopava]|uniref:Haloacid dehalogenase, type II n=1 Tax=Verruconis gallopava TaxID=253628 RepID=A0A0D2B6E9_9PEZI|nr:haloacid dehalogenase, type II [Verruconis gallopava]KIW06814.1 haloacid dehalogenase, type II [Verruconis gallopava]
MPAQLVPSDKPLTSFKLLSFDVYGTLIDWEEGIYRALMATQPFATLPAGHELRDRKTLLKEAEKRERAVQVANPSAEYALVLSEAYKRLVSDYKLEAAGGVAEGAESFGNSVGAWPCFPDTLEALNRLKKHYYLVPLTNSSPDTFGASLKGPFKGFEFSAYYLATEIGSYKPDLRNFEYLLSHVKEKFGVEKDDILHVAQSLYHDHAPAKKIGLTSAWIDRQGAMGSADDAQYAWKFNTLAELADLVDDAFAKEQH